MPSWATQFLEIHFHGVCEEAVAFGKRWRIMWDWCGLNVCHGPYHVQLDCVWVMVSDGAIDPRQIPSTVHKVVLYRLPGEANSSSFEWPDWKSHPHLQSNVIFERS